MPKIKFSIEEIKEIYKNKDLEFIDKKYEGANVKHLTKCLRCNYIWRIRYADIYLKRRCPGCVGRPRKTLEEIKVEYLKNNLNFLDDYYINNRTKHNTKCLICLYEWKTIYNCVSSGVGCPNCAGLVKKTLKEAQELFSQNNLIFLSKEYKNASVKYDAECLKCNYIWQITYANVRSGYGCPKCSWSKNERLTINILEKLGFCSNKKEISMKNSNIQESCIVDAYFKINNLKIIVEYNGDQHFKPTYFRGRQYKEEAQKNFERQIKRDQWLREYCKDNSIILIEIDGREYTSHKIKPYLIEQLLLHNIIPPVWTISGLAD